jgi:hypothetical protein
MTEPFRVEVTIAAPVDEVWRALREPELIRRWHGWELEESGGLDAEIEQIYRQNVTESVATHTLTLQGSDTFSLHRLENGHTLVRMVRAPRGTNPEWDDFYDDISEGWTTFLHQLRFALERHPGSVRRTVFLSSATGNPVASLGLPAETESGERYTATLAGEEVSGRVWFRATKQSGYTVDGWGDGLLIAGPGMAVLTTYGQDDETYQAFRERWATWWQARLTPVP